MNPTLILEFTKLGLDLASRLITTRTGEGMDELTPDQIFHEIAKIRADMADSGEVFDRALRGG